MFRRLTAARARYASNGNWAASVKITDTPPDSIASIIGVGTTKIVVAIASRNQVTARIQDLRYTCPKPG
tara:strand:- start:15921 stop:16127 length:207 start_codon:yes stop_codon:yes gene_type:complete